MKKDRETLGQRGTYSLRVNGRVYHDRKSVFPSNNRDPMFAQLYIINDDDALAMRMQHQAVRDGNTNHGLNRETLRILQNWLKEHNE
jgi:hypothetical protein